MTESPEHEIQQTAAALDERYGGFAHGGLHLERRDAMAELAEMLGVTAEEAPKPQPGQLSFYIVVHEDGPENDDVVGDLLHRVSRRDDDLAVVQTQHHIRRAAWRGRGFMSALLAQAERWYADAGIRSVIIPAEGDGSLFAARRGFDFDLASYSTLEKYRGLDERSLRSAVVQRMMRHPGVYESIEGDNAPRRPSVRALLDRVAAAGAHERLLVEQFEARVGPSTGDVPLDAFSSPAEIAAYGQGIPLEALAGESLGRAVLRHTSWYGIKPIPLLRPAGETSPGSRSGN